MAEALIVAATTQAESVDESVERRDSNEWSKAFLTFAEVGLVFKDHQKFGLIKSQNLLVDGRLRTETQSIPSRHQLNPFCIKRFQKCEQVAHNSPQPSPA
jgi:hypothetical protein